MIVICASASPPRRWLKNAVCCAPGLPSAIVHATIRPAFGTVMRPRVGPTFAWYPVVRLTARHGRAGQLGGDGGWAVPISTISAPAVAGTARAAAAASAAIGRQRGITGIGTPCGWGEFRHRAPASLWRSARPQCQRGDARSVRGSVDARRPVAAGRRGLAREPDAVRPPDRALREPCDDRAQARPCERDGPLALQRSVALDHEVAVHVAPA